MGIVVAVKKHGCVVVAADSLTIMDGNRKYFSEEGGSDKIVKWGSSLVGVAGDAAWPLLLKSYVKGVRRKVALGSKEEIFDEWLKLHRVLREEYFLSGSEEDGFESSGLEAVIANKAGIFKVYPGRSVQEFIDFVAVGSGAPYALGAMQAVFGKMDSAEAIARAGVEAAVEFDDSSGLPIALCSVSMK